MRRLADDPAAKPRNLSGDDRITDDVPDYDDEGGQEEERSKAPEVADRKKLRRFAAKKLRKAAAKKIDKKDAQAPEVRPPTLAVPNRFARSVSFRTFNIHSLRFVLWALERSDLNAIEPGQSLKFDGSLYEFGATYADATGNIWYRKHPREVMRALKGLDQTVFDFYPTLGRIRSVPVLLEIETDAPSALRIKNGRVRIEFSPRLIECIKRDPVGRFTLLDLHDICRVRTPREANIVALLSTHRHLLNQSFVVSDDELRNRLNLVRYRSNDLWKLMQEIKAGIEARTGFRFDMKRIRSGRTLDAIEFKVTQARDLRSKKVLKRSETTKLAAQVMHVALARINKKAKKNNH